MAFTAVLSARVLSYLVFAAVCVFLLYSRNCIEQSVPLSPNGHAVPVDAHSIHNFTLGLDEETGLKKDASATGIDLTIFESAKPDDFRGGEDSNRCRLACAFEQMSLAAERRPPPDSPYGNDWDVLWLGHCGKNSEAFLSSTNDATEVPRALVCTAPDGRPLEGRYPGTDIYLISDKPVGELCLSSYAVNYRGATKLLNFAEDRRGLMDQNIVESTPAVSLDGVGNVVLMRALDMQGGVYHLHTHRSNLVQKLGDITTSCTGTR
ncbi:hypothetical protein HO173_008525 [Letharia columbiana]|uniref:Uncharacterized protein n=1 Tax=Letharia columbiana TaxID=112416 RepID=A0A8H6FR87_9LECA|nr:uncharacterized protein HO173_008525 [Letharia columbiana]KAF6233236.1 hypothetical protein HO173_008525 [Letharia columbiana]